MRFRRGSAIFRKIFKKCPSPSVNPEARFYLAEKGLPQRPQRSARQPSSNLHKQIENLFVQNEIKVDALKPCIIALRFSIGSRTICRSKDNPYNYLNPFFKKSPKMTPIAAKKAPILKTETTHQLFRKNAQLKFVQICIRVDV